MHFLDYDVPYVFLQDYCKVPHSLWEIKSALQSFWWSSASFLQTLKNLDFCSFYCVFGVTYGVKSSNKLLSMRWFKLLPKISGPICFLFSSSPYYYPETKINFKHFGEATQVDKGTQIHLNLGLHQRSTKIVFGNHE